MAIRKHLSVARPQLHAPAPWPHAPFAPHICHGGNSTQTQNPKPNCHSTHTQTHTLQSCPPPVRQRQHQPLATFGFLPGPDSGTRVARVLVVRWVWQLDGNSQQQQQCLWHQQQKQQRQQQLKMRRARLSCRLLVVPVRSLTYRHTQAYFTDFVVVGVFVAAHKFACHSWSTSPTHRPASGPFFLPHRQRYHHHQAAQLTAADGGNCWLLLMALMMAQWQQQYFLSWMSKDSQIPITPLI